MSGLEDNGYIESDKISDKVFINKKDIDCRKYDISKIKYIIFSDIDDTLYTNTIMTKKINPTHDLIHRIDNKHIVFISARPEVSFLRYLTKMRLTKDFTIFTLLMGNIMTVCWYIFLYMLYLLTLKKISYLLKKAQKYIGTKKIHKFQEYLQSEHATLFSKEYMNCIIFMGDNFQGDEYIGEYIITNMNNYVVYDKIKYSTMCIVLIRDAAQKYTFPSHSDVQFAPLDGRSIFPHDHTKNESDREIIHSYNNYKNMFITSLECNILDILSVIKRHIYAEIGTMEKNKI